MSIVTKRGDDGHTDCLYGRRISKSSQLIEAIGALDELNAWVGYAVEQTNIGWKVDIQEHLVSIMGELSAGTTNFEKFKAQFGCIGQTQIDALEQRIKDIENKRSFHDWVAPHNALDLACRVCRRAERELIRHSDREGVRKEIVVYINRLSDYLWILARPLKENEDAKTTQ